MSVMLVTRGMIKSCCNTQIVVAPPAGPTMQQTLEVRPTIRHVAGPEVTVGQIPVNISAEEMRPVMREADAPAPPDPGAKPVQTSTQELKPKITDVEED